MDDKKRAIASIKKLAERKLKPHVDKAGKKIGKKISKAVSSGLGMDEDDLKRVLGVAEALRSQKVKGSYKLGKDTSLDGEIDIKKKLIKLGLNHSF